MVGLIYLRDAIHSFSSAEMIAQIQYAREQPEIRAVVLVIDSPVCKVGEGEGFGATGELDEFEFDLEFEEVFSD